MSLTDQELRARAASPEDNLTEHKSEGFKPEELRRTVVAFANTVPEAQVAVLFIGIDDKGNAAGVRNPDSVQARIAALLQECYPPIPIVCRVIELGGKPIVAVQVTHTAQRPHFSGSAYVRQGSQSVKASEQLFQELIDRRTDKVNDLLNLRGAPAYRIELIDKMIRSPKREPGYHGVVLGYVQDCNRHYVVLRDAQTGTVFSEPLDFVSLGWDVEKHQPKIVVRFKG